MEEKLKNIVLVIMAAFSLFLTISCEQEKEENIYGEYEDKTSSRMKIFFPMNSENPMKIAL